MLKVIKGRNWLFPRKLGDRWMSLNEIVKFYNSGRNKKALAIITEIADPSIEVLIFKCYILNRMSKSDEAYNLANEILEKSRSSSDAVKFSALAVKVRSIGGMGKTEWTLAKEYISSAEDIFEGLNDQTKSKLKRWSAELLFDKAFLEFMLVADKKSALSIFNQCKILYEDLGDKRGTAFTESWKAACTYHLGKINEAKIILEENLIFTQSHQIWDGKAFTLGTLSYMLNMLGDSEIALQKCKEAVLLVNEYDFKWVGAWVGKYLALIYSSLGQYELAIKELNKVIDTTRYLGDLHNYCSALFYLADIERKLGDIDSAIIKFEKSRIILEEIKDVVCTIDVNFRLAKAFISKNDYQKAYQPLLRSFEIRGWKDEEGIKTPLSIYYYTETLLELIIVTKGLSKDLEAEKYIGYLESFVSSHSTERFNFQLNLAKALIEKKGSRAKYRISAQNKLEELVAQRIKDDELNTRAIINYCELLLEELKTYGEKEVLDEIITLSKKLSVIAERQKASPLKIEGLLLEGQLLLIKGEAEISMNKFNQAYDLATKYKLKRFEKKASMLIENLEREIEKWETLYNKNIPMIERIDNSKIISYINKAIKVRDFLAD